MEPSLRVSLKGLKRTRDAREFYTSSAPYNEGKSLRLVVIGIGRISKATERIRFVWLSSCCPYPEPLPGRPLIYMGGARRFTVSRARL